MEPDNIYMQYNTIYLREREIHINTQIFILKININNKMKMISIL